MVFTTGGLSVAGVSAGLAAKFGAVTAAAGTEAAPEDIPPPDFLVGAAAADEAEPGFSGTAESDGCVTVAEGCPETSDAD
jgi:hypothetical protein